ncbi:hypothetical protein [Methylophaga sp.]|uniref:hypothetical protein n=1 Tax=Methylophaga sp. TaxID=2024840 RepID=UPI0013FF4498|nr:hypothetical protein [Methylophaga sp.]MTI62679.1 hypothetical protein [Methylophaga sp.]
MKYLSTLKTVFLAFALTQVMACTSTTILPAPSQSEDIAIQFTDESLSGFFDLPGGVHRVPESQVIISGHQSNSWVGSVLGPIGLSLQSAIDAENAESAISNTEAMLQFKLTEAANAIADELIAQPEFAYHYTDYQTPRTPVLNVKTAVILTYQNETDVKPYVLLQAALKDARANTDIWWTRYIASSGPARPFSGENGWAANDGQAFEDNIAQNLEKAIKLMMTDVATPYPRYSSEVITVQGFYPYVRYKMQTVGYKMDETDTHIIYQPKLGDAIVFSGVHLIDKSTVDIRPTQEGDAVYKILEEEENTEQSQTE